jgi:hypothetical protein
MGTKLITTALHTGSIGDVWASLPTLKELHRKTGSKVILYLTKNQRTTYYVGATHPTRDDDGTGEMVLLNSAMIKMMIPLLKAQPYIEDAKVHKDEPIGLNLNRIRETFVNQPYHSLAKWYFYIFPDLMCDLAKPYIEVPDTDYDFAKDKIIIARTERYLNANVEYKFLKKYQKNIVFAGTDLEYRLFKARYYINIPRLKINNFLELAQAIKQSKGVISNQTQIAQICEGMKTNRAVELCSFAPNVDFVGENGYEFYAQDGLEYFFHKFNGTENQFIEERKKKVLEQQKKPDEAGLIINPGLK